MFVHKTKQEIEALEANGNAVHISLFDSLENAERHYKTVAGTFTAYKEDESNLTHAFSTPVLVYSIRVTNSCDCN